MSVEEEWITELVSETMGYQHRHPRELIQHLRDTGANLDHMEVTELTQELQKPWDMVEAPATLFARGDKIEHQLTKAGQRPNPELRLAFALTNIEASGEYNAAVCEWKAKANADKTFARFHGFIQKEFALRHKNNKSTARSVRHGIANTVKEQNMEAQIQAEAAAYAIQEVANALRQEQDKKFDQMLKMMETVLKAQSNNPVNLPANLPGNQNGGSGNGGGRKGCKHCRRNHPKPDECWELEKNKEKRPSGYKTKSEREVQNS